MQKRSIAFFALLLLGFCGLMTHFLTLASNTEAAVLSGQSTATVTVATARGTIYDRDLRPLVNDTTETRLCIAPYSRTVAALSKVLPSEAFALLSERLQGGRPVVSIVDVEPSPVEGVLAFKTPVRNGNTLFAPHLVGYLAGDGVNGAVGIEHAYNDFLNACGGTLTATYEINAAGHLLAEQDPVVLDTLSSAAAGVVLTLDKEIQVMAESVAKTELKKGAVVILDAATAEVLAAVSVPSFQPDTVAENLEAADSPLLDRVLCNYNCGSVFKIVSAAAALEGGVSTARRYPCNGSVSVDGIVFHCHNRLGHGELDMTEAFACSCNCYFIQLIQDVGANALYNMAVTLGFDRAVLLADGYRTARAVLPTAEELQVSRAALANLSFGQGALLASPVHAAQLVHTVLNGGELLRPSVVKGTVDGTGVVTPIAQTPPQTAFSSATAATLQQMMVAAVGEGATGEAANPLNGGAGGKTGTAESGWITERGEAVQNWFVGFYPAEQPRYVLAVLAEDSGATGASAAPVFHRLCDGLHSISLEK